MKKFLLTACALTLGLALAGTATAAERHHYTRPARVSVGVSYHSDHGVRFNGGYYYRGRDHHHWQSRVWDARYNRYHYYDPNVRVYYYWDAPRGCYYPVGW